MLSTQQSKQSVLRCDWHSQALKCPEVAILFDEVNYVIDQSRPIVENKSLISPCLNLSIIIYRNSQGKAAIVECHFNFKWYNLPSKWCHRKVLHFLEFFQRWIGRLLKGRNGMDETARHCQWRPLQPVRCRLLASSLELSSWMLECSIVLNDTQTLYVHRYPDDDDNAFLLNWRWNKE